MRRRVVLVGASGVFGSRLARMLAGLPDLEIVLAARDTAALERLRGDLAADAIAMLSIAPLDRRSPDGLATLAPWCVVDAAGPFQGSAFALVAAAIAAGAHYVDLADARDFVACLPAALGAAARAAGVTVVTGASSTPALSHAALDRLTEGWRRIDAIKVAISPGARAPRGRAVMEAILFYVGRPVRVFDDGVWRAVPGWSGLQQIDMPGLGRRWVSICETADLDLLPARYVPQRTALFMAGLELAPMHLGLAALGLLVRWRLVRSLVPLARPLRTLAGLLVPFGSDRGGMIVEAYGLDADGRTVVARWSLCAEANAGPNVPAAPAAALIRALAEGLVLSPGAFAAAGRLALDDILRELAHLPITTRVDVGAPDDPVLFRRLLGSRFDALPAPVRAVHGGGAGQFEGDAVVRAGPGLIARLVRHALGLPRSGRCLAQVRFTCEAAGETWMRRFGEACFISRLVDTGRLGLFEERIGPLRFLFDLRASPAGVAWDLVGWRCLAVPLPRRLAPRMRAGAEAAGTRYRFRVVVVHAWIGLVFAYRGTLEAERLVTSSPAPPAAFP